MIKWLYATIEIKLTVFYQKNERDSRYKKNIEKVGRLNYIYYFMIADANEESSRLIVIA